MADNVPITAGAGTDIATDEVAVNGGSTAHVQFVKLVDGAANGTTGIPGTAQGLGTIPRRDLQRISVQSAGLTTTTPTYSAGDQVGTLFTFADAARSSGGSGTIVGATLISAADIIGAYDLAIFDTSVTLSGGDNGAFAISDTDALRLVGIVQFGVALDIGNNRVAQAYNLAIPYVCNGGTSLFGSLICRFGHGVFAAVTDLQVILYVERN